MTDRPYRLPNPKTQPAAFLVLVYKALKRIQYDNRAWDKLYFARCMKRTTELLDNLGGDVQVAAKCMGELKDRFENDELSWTIETIVQYSFEWASENQKISDRECVKRLFGDYGQVAGTGGLVKMNPQEVLKKLMELPAPPNEAPYEISE